MKYLFLLLLISDQSFCQTPIEKNEIITIGGIKQYIRIKGKDSSKPLLLCFHGGPGSSLMGKADGFTGKLQRQFVGCHFRQNRIGSELSKNLSFK